MTVGTLINFKEENTTNVECPSTAEIGSFTAANPLILTFVHQCPSICSRLADMKSHHKGNDHGNNK